MPIDAILRHAGWKSKSSFVRRYMKYPLTAVTDKHGFSKVWGSKLGEHLQLMVEYSVFLPILRLKMSFVEKAKTQVLPLPPQ